MDISVIIVNWNSADYLRACLQSLRLALATLAHEVIVVDNASFDGSAEMVAAQFPAFRFIQSDCNLGFSGANNLAARLARGDLLLFLNPDTGVEPGSLIAMIRHLRRLPGAGIVGPRLLNSDGTLQTSCIQSFPTVLNQVLDSEFLRKLFPNSRLWGTAAFSLRTPEPSPVQAVSGACLMIKRSVFDAVKGFEERYFMYSEDLDLCYRSLQAGYRSYYVPTAEVFHHGGGSSKAAPSAFSVVMMRQSIHEFMHLRRGRSSAFCLRAALGLVALLRLPLVLMCMAVRKLLPGFASPVSFRKWVAILRWCLGFEPCVKRGGAGRESKQRTQGIPQKCDSASASTASSR